MATPAQIANDLDAHAQLLRGTGHDTLVKSLRRGAKTLRTLIAENDALATRAVVVGIEINGVKP